MPDLTKAFAKAYDAIRLVTLPEKTELNLYDDDGNLIETVTKGWTFEEKAGEHTGERVVEVRVTDLNNSDFNDVVFLGFSGIRYERTNPSNPPIGNPREWVWTVKPAGLDS